MLGNLLKSKRSYKISKNALGSYKIIKATLNVNVILIQCTVTISDVKVTVNLPKPHPMYHNNILQVI